MRALLDGQRVIMDIAVDPRAFQHHQFAHIDRAAHGAREPRGFSGHAAHNLTAFALDQRGAADIAFNVAIDVQVGGGGDVALDFDIGSEDRKG